MNRNTFPEFSQILYQQFSTFHSTLVVIHPGQALFERNGMFPTAFLILRAYWIVSAGPSGHLEQSIQGTVFEQRAKSTVWAILIPTEMPHIGPTIVKY